MKSISNYEIIKGDGQPAYACLEKGRRPCCRRAQPTNTIYGIYN